MRNSIQTTLRLSTMEFFNPPLFVSLPPAVVWARMVGAQRKAAVCKLRYVRSLAFVCRCICCIWVFTGVVTPTINAVQLIRYKSLLRCRNLGHNSSERMSTRGLVRMSSDDRHFNQAALSCPAFVAMRCRVRCYYLRVLALDEPIMASMRELRCGRQTLPLQRTIVPPQLPSRLPVWTWHLHSRILR